MKRITCMALVMCLLISCMSLGVSAADDQAAGDNSRYTGLVLMSAALDISDIGRAYTSVTITLRNGYTAKLHAELTQEGVSTLTTVKDWDISIPEGGDIWAGVYYVAKGYWYYTTITLDVYTTSGKFVETVVLDSNSVYY